MFFGGARGGGKTDGLLGDWLSYALQYGPAAQGIILRKSYPELEEVETRAHSIYSQVGAEYKASRKTWMFANGARLKMRYLMRPEDASMYQGHSYSYIGVDELTNWPTSFGLDKLRACLRSPHGIPCLFRATGNPGGVGHNWVKARYVDPSPPGKSFVDPETGARRVYIPARLEDNTVLMQNDPDYWKRVEAAAGGRNDLIKAWRYGVWDIIAGGMFDDLWNPLVHVIAPFKIPKTWRVDRTFDWGSSKPFCVQWWAESDGSDAPNGKRYPRGTLFHISEWYGTTGKPNKGLQTTDTEIARRIKEIEAGMIGTLIETVPLPGPADIPPVENGVSMADNMARLGVRWESRAKLTGNRVTGWQAARRLMKASLSDPMEEPGLFVFDTCRHFIRTVPVIIRDENKPDDVDTESEDHAADAMRYRVMAMQRSVKEVKLVGW